VSSYRASHDAKGENYHRTFTDLPYRQIIWRLEQRALDHLVGSVATPTRYLDFACGTGRILGHLESSCRVAVGVDVSASMLEVARKECARASIVRGDVTTGCCFKSHAFDLITAFRFFPNAEEELRQSAMAALAQLLSAEGYLVFNNHRNRSSLRNLAKRAVRRGVSSGMSHREVVALTASAGLAIERIYHIGLWPGSEFRKQAPVGLERIERALTRVAMLRPWANDIIYVCRHAGRPSR
jgi:predicted TPR repeat methyltransferase